MSIFNHEFDAETTPLYFSLALTRSYDIYIVYFPAVCNLYVMFWIAR